MKLLPLLILLGLSVLNKSYSQDSLYRGYVDSILASESKKTIDKKEIINDSTDITYFYAKNGNKPYIIEVCTLGNDRTMWWYTYYFINEKLAKLNKSNKQTLQKKKEAMYYFKNDRLAFKQESGTQITDLQMHFKAAIKMRVKTPKS